MKALSIWQPWASLIATGAKDIETRGWATTYRGPLLICAAKRQNLAELTHHLSGWYFQGGLGPLVGQPLSMPPAMVWPGVGIEHLPFGKAVCIADVLDCVPVEKMPHGDFLRQQYFCDFSAGRFAWMLRVIRVFKYPFDVVGHQGLWNYEGPIPEEFTHA